MIINPSHNISVIRFETPLGRITFGLTGNPVGYETAAPRRLKQGGINRLASSNYTIESAYFKLPDEMDQSRSITGSLGVFWRIQKLTDIVDPISLYCSFLADRNITPFFDNAAGESLDAIEISNGDWTLYIGTEDDEMLRSRALKNDELPSRLAEAVNFNKAFTTKKRAGFTTYIPHLNKDERFYMQYLTAYGRQQKENLDNWLAVDIPKQKIEAWIRN